MSMTGTVLLIIVPFSPLSCYLFLQTDAVCCLHLHMQLQELKRDNEGTIAKSGHCPENLSALAEGIIKLKQAKKNLKTQDLINKCQLTGQAFQKFNM